MDIQRLLRDHGISYITEGKHCTEGWVNTHCPFCAGSKDYHLGIHEDGKGAHCWRCGRLNITRVLSGLLNLSEAKTQAIMREYHINLSGGLKRAGEPKVSIYPFKLPKPNTSLTKLYKKYLIGRKFNPDEIEREWGVNQTGPISFLDGISYSHRILIPIHWNGEVVSFQARDITGRSERKYLACPKQREKIHHKDILYGKQEIWEDSNGIIVVEGVTDVWRLGGNAAATFGIEFKMEQVLQLAKHHTRFFTLFDDEPQAQRQAKKLATKLKTLGREVYIEKVEGDPGGMKQDDANHLVKQLLMRFY